MSGSFWLHRVVCPWLFSFGLGLSLLAGVAHAQPVTTPALERLAEQAGRQGSVRVIVGLQVATRPEGSLTAMAVSQQRSQIRAAQQSVERMLAGTQFNVHGRLATIPFVGMQVDANAMARLRASPLVRDIQEDLIATPSLGQSVPLIQGTTAWSNGATGAGWAVAVLDTGVDKTHPHLQKTSDPNSGSKVVAEACYSSTVTNSSTSLCPGGVASSEQPGSAMPCASGCAHGTHVAAIAAGQNGVANAADIVAIQVFSYFTATSDVRSYSFDQMMGLDQVQKLATRATNPIKIASVNMSLGGGKYFSNCDGMAIKASIDNLRSIGIPTVIASGNDDFTNAISGPACVSSSVSVTATCDGVGGYCAGTDAVAGYANVASFVSLAAPGSVITSAVPGTATASWHGTSMAAPHVAGAWALLKQVSPSRDVSSGLAWLRNNAVTLNDTRQGATVTGLKRISLGAVGTAAMASESDLTVTRQGTGAGKVQSVSPSTVIDCGSNCVAGFPAGAVVSLTATPQTGSVFSGWSSVCSGSSPCNVTMDGAKSVVATFNLAQAAGPTLTVSKSGNGTVTSSPAGITCGTACSASFTLGSTVTLTATLSGKSRSVTWRGACTGTSRTCSLTINGPTSVSAAFK